VSRAFVWGKFKELPPLTASYAERLCAQADARRQRAAERHHWKTIDILHRTGLLWADPKSPFRRRAQALMPVVSGFSPEMVRRTLAIIPALLDRDVLRKRLSSELGRPDALDAWSLEPESQSALKAFPLGSVLHVAAGNVFLGCIDSIVMSLLTNNVTLLRLSSTDTEFPLLFAESLLKADTNNDLTDGLSILSWPKGDEKIELVFKRRLQGVVIWGGENAVSAYRIGLGVGTKLIAFGPKLSFGVVSRAGLRGVGYQEAARRLARDVSWWDQAACASPQTVFVQGGRPDEFLDALAAALAREGRAVPPGPAAPDEAASVLEERQLALAAELTGAGRLLAPRGQGWTAAWNKRAELTASPLRRFIHVRPYRDLAHLRALVAPSSAYLQSAGLLVAPAEAGDYAEALAQAGISRAPALGRMLESETGEPHDGRYPLAELVRWVSGPAEAVCANEKKALAGLLEQAAAESTFYRRRLKKSRLLDKNDLYAYAPPRSNAILTHAAPDAGRLVFASGGSTGKPKFCLYTQDEFESTCRWLAWGLKRSGLDSGDVVANLFVAGNLWSSFMAISGAARALSVTHLPVAGTADPALALDALKRFKANVLIGLPSTLLDLARFAASRGERLRVDKIFYAGEHASDEMRREWARAFGVTLVRSAGYASVDAGLIGFQCGRAAGGVHHAASGLQRVEIVSPATGRPVAPGEAGEIVATNLIRRWMPVIRYRTGDLGRWTGRPCPCGHPAPLFALLGRCDDRVNIGGAHLDAGDVGRAIGSVAGLSPVYQLVAEPGEKLLVRVEKRAAKTPEAGLAAKLGDALLRTSHELRDSVERGWLKAPSVEILAPGKLPRQPRTGKIRRVVDLRR